MNRPAYKAIGSRNSNMFVLGVYVGSYGMYPVADSQFKSLFVCLLTKVVFSVRCWVSWDHDLAHFIAGGSSEIIWGSLCCDRPQRVWWIWKRRVNTRAACTSLVQILWENSVHESRPISENGPTFKRFGALGEYIDTHLVIGRNYCPAKIWVVLSLKLDETWLETSWKKTMLGRWFFPMCLPLLSLSLSFAFSCLSPRTLSKDTTL